jgi:thioredoxin 1
MMPAIENTMIKFDALELMSVNVDEDPDSAVEHRVRSVPTLVLLKNGEVAGRLCGARSAEEIEVFLLQHL